MSEAQSISLIVCVIGGFRQDHNDTMTGMARLHRSIAHEWFDRRTSMVMLEDWRTRAKVLGDKIANACPRTGRNPHIVIVSYSWGNPTAQKVIARLRDYGITVDLWFAVDPVIRMRQVWWSPLNILALTTLGRFDRPDNLISLRLYRQFNDRPAGRDFSGYDVITDGRTLFGRPASLKGQPGRHIITPSVGHNQIDDDDVIHQDILRELRELAPAKEAA